jgi:hypothetical protein
MCIFAVGKHGNSNNNSYGDVNKVKKQNEREIYLKQGNYD